MILKLDMQHRGIRVYKVYINYDPGLTLTYFTAMSNVVAYGMGETVKKSFNRENLQHMTKWTEDLCFEENFTQGGCLPLLQGYVHVWPLFSNMSLKPFSQSKPSFIWSLLSKGENKGIKIMDVMPADGKNAFISRRGLIIFKLGFEHQGLQVYKVYIIYDPWLTFANLMAMLNLQNLLLGFS